MALVIKRLTYLICCSFLFHYSAFAEIKVSSAKYQFGSIEYLIEQQIGALVLPQIYHNLGIEINITPLPANRAQQLARLGRTDGEIMRIWTYGVQNPSLIRVPTPYYTLETMPFVLKRSNITIAKKLDLKNYRVAVVRGVKHTENITEGLRGVYLVSSTKRMFELLLLGKVDVALTNTMDGLSTIKAMSTTDIMPMEKPLAELDLYHYIHQKHEKLVPRLDQEIQQMVLTGELQQLILNAEDKILRQ